MYSYRFMQWIIFFYIYCFLGWCYESAYVSIKGKKVTNRGFMKGPMLPIYGSGAMVVLIATLPVKENMLLVFFMGMAAATLLELITGIVMEALFKVRYWDYSNQPCNFKGHICLGCSLAWGVFSVFIVNVLHKPIEYLIVRVNYDVLCVITFCVTIIAIVDFTCAFKAAIDLRELLIKLTKENEELARLQKRIDVLIAVVDDDKNQIISELDELKKKSELIRNKILYRTDEIGNSIKWLIKGQPSATSRRFKGVFDEVKEYIKSNK